MEARLTEVLDEIQCARRELTTFELDLTNCEKRVEECINAATKAMERRDQVRQRLNDLTLKLRSTLSDDFTTSIEVLPPRVAEPEEIGRAG